MLQRTVLENLFVRSIYRVKFVRDYRNEHSQEKRRFILIFCTEMHSHSNKAELRTATQCSYKLTQIRLDRVILYLRRRKMHLLANFMKNKRKLATGDYVHKNHNTI